MGLTTPSRKTTIVEKPNKGGKGPARAVKPERRRIFRDEYKLCIL
jgi:hypothetical protein